MIIIHSKFKLKIDRVAVAEKTAIKIKEIKTIEKYIIFSYKSRIRQQKEMKLSKHSYNTKRIKIEDTQKNSKFICVFEFVNKAAA